MLMIHSQLEILGENSLKICEKGVKSVENESVDKTTVSAEINNLLLFYVKSVLLLFLIGL